MTPQEQIASLSDALDRETDNRKRGFMRLQLRRLEYRLNRLREEA